MNSIVRTLILCILLWVSVNPAPCSNQGTMIRARNFHFREEPKLASWYLDCLKLVQEQTDIDLAEANENWPTVGFRLTETNQAEDIELFKSSGQKDLDEKIIAAISKVKEFPKPDSYTPYETGLVLRKKQDGHFAMKLFSLTDVPNFVDKLSEDDLAEWKKMMKGTVGTSMYKRWLHKPQ